MSVAQAAHGTGILDRSLSHRSWCLSSTFIKGSGFFEPRPQPSGEDKDSEDGPDGRSSNDGTKAPLSFEDKGLMMALHDPN